ncbi:hypothetical protein [Cytobacillus stercorigallinarum]|nr:hypothetical protein [Cytobacillus stercorigallinarum]
MQSEKMVARGEKVMGLGDKKVYILLTDTGTYFTKLIKVYTKRSYNHASIAFDHELAKVYSFGRKKPRNPFIGGFVVEDINKGLLKHADCIIYSFTVNHEELRKMEQYIATIESEKEDYRYNLFGLFGVLFNKPLKRRKAFFCSQFVASVIHATDSIEFEKPLSLITPYDLRNIPSIQVEYEGKLNEYLDRDTAPSESEGSFFVSI